MALAIYKPGQGYWTRVLTAVGAAVLILAGVGWLWNQMNALGTGATTINPSLTDASARLSAWGASTGNAVSTIAGLRHIQTLDGQPPTFKLTDSAGQSFGLDAGQLQAALNQPAPNQVIDRNQQLSRLPSGAHVNQGRLIVEMPATFAYQNRIYIQSIVAVAVILAFGAIIYWLLNKARIVDFMIATEAEMRKVNWPTRREIAGSTWIVICGTLMMAMLLLVVDILFAELFINVNVLEGESIFQSLFSKINGG